MIRAFLIVLWLLAAGWGLYRALPSSPWEYIEVEDGFTGVKERSYEASLGSSAYATITCEGFHIYSVFHKDVKEVLVNVDGKISSVPFTQDGYTVYVKPAPRMRFIMPDGVRDYLVPPLPKMQRLRCT